MTAAGSLSDASTINPFLQLQPPGLNVEGSSVDTETTELTTHDSNIQNVANPNDANDTDTFDDFYSVVSSSDATPVSSHHIHGMSTLENSHVFFDGPSVR